MAGPTLYDVIGVERGVSPAELRRAYVERARRFHPDGFVDATPDEQRRAERSMQDLNEAWRVLGHPDRRRHYDQTLAQGTTRTPHDSEDRYPSDVDDDDEPLPGSVPFDVLSWAVRVLPWLLLLAVLAAIFVFTAYAGEAVP
jgi:DnaJ-class molecular chaperone